MKKREILFVFALTALISCGKLENRKEDSGEKEKATCSVSGYAQKGQLVKGSQITAFAIGEDLIATGESFPANISNDMGAFSITGKTSAPYLELRAQGYYFNEVSGGVTDSPIYLEAFTKSTDTDVNLNLLTTITKERIKKLIALGKGYDEAKKQAQTELLDFINAGSTSADFTKMDIAKDSDADALLLAVTCRMQNGRSISELTTAIQSAATEFQEYGSFSKKTGLELFQYDKPLDVLKIYDNLEKYYSDKGITTAKIPPFWKYLGEEWDVPFKFIDSGDSPIGVSYPEGMEPTDARSVSYKIFATKPFNVSSDADWITFEKKEKAENIFIVDVNVKENTGMERRIGHIIFSDADAKELARKEFIQGPNCRILILTKDGGGTKSSVNMNGFAIGEKVTVNGCDYLIAEYYGECGVAVPKVDSYTVCYPAGVLGTSSYFSRASVNYPATRDDNVNPVMCGALKGYEGIPLSSVSRVTMTYISGIISLNLTGFQNVGYITIAGNKNENIAGTFEFPIYPNDVNLDPQLDPKTIEGNIKEVRVNETDNDGKLALEIPSVVLETGMTIKVYDKSGSLIVTRTNSNRIEIDRARLYNITVSNQ